MAEAPEKDDKFRAASLVPRPRSGDRPISIEQLTLLAPFQGLAADALAKQIKSANSFVLRCYENGETICRQGDTSAFTAFYILTHGELRSLVSGAPAAGDGPRGELRTKAQVLVAQRSVATVGGSGWLYRFFGMRERWKAEEKPVLKRRAGLEGDYRVVGTLYEGELFGEMSCLNRVPRSATILAIEQTYAVEMIDSVLRRVQENKANKEFRERLDAVYRERALQSHLMSFPLFQSDPEAGEEVPAAIVEELRRRVELVELKPGDVFIREGDAPDDVYLISIGQVRIMKATPGGERVIAVRLRGDILGEVGVLTDSPRTATCVAYDHPLMPGKRKPKVPGRIELVRIRNADFRWLLEAAPVIERRVRKIMAERINVEDEPAEITSDTALLGTTGLYHELGLVQGQKLMLIDLDRCTRCDECVRACVRVHNDGRTRLIREGPRFGNFLIPASCRQCRDPVCMIGCPVSSIHKGPGNEIVIEDWCIGCMSCANQCPYEAIQMYERDPAARIRRELAEATRADAPVALEPPSLVEAKLLSGQKLAPLTSRDDVIASVCDQCQSLADGVPSCVYACPHEAAMRVDALEYFSARLGAAEPAPARGAS